VSTAVEILDVSISKTAADEVLACGIDEPKTGSQLETRTLPVSGWVLTRDGPADAIEFVYDGRTIRRTSCNGRRPDVSRLHPAIPGANSCGFYALLGVVGLTPEFKLDVRAVLRDGAQITIGSVTARHSPLRTKYKPKLSPIILTSLARTGTTWLMKLLGTHPQIVVYPRHPYEMGTGSYWAHAVKVLSEPADPVLSSKRATYINDLWHVGQNPFHNRNMVERDDARFARWLGNTYVERLATFFQQNIDDWYLMVAESQAKEQAVYFAEKHAPVHIPVVLREIYPNAREIFLVRDFRDMASSMIAFNKQRGFQAFGADGKTSEEFLDTTLKQSALALYRAWRSRENASHLVRYEDLVSRPTESLIALLRHLDLDSSTETVNRMLHMAAEEGADSREHTTSESLERSVGRWRDDPEDFRASSQDAFRDVLREFGYE
jgi:hypothetical protein